VDSVLCVIDRLAGGKEALAARGLRLQALFTKEDLDEVRRAVSPVIGRKD
jgi:orotate phosphoribosyltransferase